MSREIKFRAWDKETNKYFEPTYQSYMGRLEELTIALSGRLQKRTCRGVAGESTFHGRYVVEQYTGLKDSNGDDIYENDLVLLDPDDPPYQVIFDEGKFELSNDYLGLVYDLSEEHMDCEIVGNVHEDQELLEEEK